MFGNPLFRGIEDDPFFGGGQQHFSNHMQHMADMHRQMEQMMGGMFRDPFMAGSTQPALAYDRDYTRRADRHRERDHRPRQDVMPYGGSMDPFSGMFGSMLQNMNSMMTNMNSQMDRARTDPNAHFYSSSTVMSYSNDGSGAPKVYQASSSTRQAPGGIKETRKSVRDSHAGIEKMAVGHHINDQAHVISRERNTNTGDVEQNTDLVNLEEEERDAFEREWQQRTQSFNRSLGGGVHRPRHQVGLTDGRHGNRPSNKYRPSAAEGLEPVRGKAVRSKDRDRRQKGKEPRVRINSRAENI